MNKSYRLLVAGDSPTGLGQLTTMLVTAGYQVRVADSREQALSAATAGQADLVLLDLCGLGPEGIDVCRRLKAQPDGSGIPVVLVGPHLNDDWRLAGLLAGAADIIEKPFHLEELLTSVRLQLELGRLQAALAAKAEELRWVSDARRQGSPHQACAA